jgi:hypothetical protein
LPLNDSSEGKIVLGAMMRRAILFVSAIASTLLSSGAFAAGPFGAIHIGNWQGGAYTNDTTGAFSHCAAGGNFANGLSLLISQNAERTWMIGFTSPSWNFPEGQPISIDLTFDGFEFSEPLHNKNSYPGSCRTQR